MIIVPIDSSIDWSGLTRAGMMPPIGLVSGMINLNGIASGAILSGYHTTNIISSGPIQSGLILSGNFGGLFLGLTSGWCSSGNMSVITSGANSPGVLGPPYQIPPNLQLTRTSSPNPVPKQNPFYKNTQDW